MAELERRFWSDIDTEVTKLIGSPDNPSVALRIQHWISDKYWQIGTRWFHQELVVDDFSTTLKMGSAEVALSEETYIVFGVALLEPDTNVSRGWLPGRDPRTIIGTFNKSTGDPESVSRLGFKLLFDRPSIQDYGLRIMRYKFPNPPDFSTTANEQVFPETSRLWDDPIILASAALGSRRLWAPHIAAQFEQEFEAIVALIPQPMLAVDGIADFGEEERISKLLGGMQG